MSGAKSLKVANTQIYSNPGNTHYGHNIAHVYKDELKVNVLGVFTYLGGLIKFDAFVIIETEKPATRDYPGFDVKVDQAKEDEYLREHYSPRHPTILLEILKWMKNKPWCTVDLAQNGVVVAHAVRDITARTVAAKETEAEATARLHVAQVRELEAKAVDAEAQVQTLAAEERIRLATETLADLKEKAELEIARKEAERAERRRELALCRQRRIEADKPIESSIEGEKPTESSIGKKRGHEDDDESFVEKKRSSTAQSAVIQPLVASAPMVLPLVEPVTTQVAVVGPLADPPRHDVRPDAKSEEPTGVQAVALAILEKFDPFIDAVSGLFSSLRN